MLLTGQQLHIDRIFLDDELIDIPEDQPVINVDDRNRLEYSIDLYISKNVRLRIEKEDYFPYSKTYVLPEISFQDNILLDLGEIGMLNEVKEDAMILTWKDHPTDLDLRLVCPNGETIGIIENDDPSTTESNYYAKMSSDSKNGYGPETIIINHWVNFSDKHRIGGEFKLKVKWYRD